MGYQICTYPNPKSKLKLKPWVDLKYPTKLRYPREPAFIYLPKQLMNMQKKLEHSVCSTLMNQLQNIQNRACHQLFGLKSKDSVQVELKDLSFIG